ncbi:MAG: hypothetical protein ASARMPRED_001094 [Alectoria sarmentosa]|nr:MAG: hypothetical protein ASARMPRED_001094 [Alectoria sarmentosa]
MSIRDPDPLDTLLQEVQVQFEQQLQIEELLALSKKLQAELRQHMIFSPQCMLPSFNYELPTGQERGTYLALEVGGSNLRMALVELNGRNLGMRMRRTEHFPIDTAIRQLKAYEFFDWMAERVRELLGVEAESAGHIEGNGLLPMGVAWSFPLDQTSIRSGNVLGMGKGFQCSEHLIGRDLGEIITKACQHAVFTPSYVHFLGFNADSFALQKLNVRLDAIVNDSSSALLARAYLDPATRLATILGTGMNAAVHLPAAALDSSKFRSRLPSVGTISHVLTNTELSMFGKNIFPTTRWDDILNRAHVLPDYQPFEYLVAGKYIGEIVRLIIVEATQTARLFSGLLPPSLGNDPYTVDTKDLAFIDIDTSHGLAASRSLFYERHPSPHLPSEKDIMFIKDVVKRVSTRSIAYFTTGIHALTVVLQRLETIDMGHVTIGCDGSIINNYPGFMEGAQEMLDQMIGLDKLEAGKRVILERTTDSAVLGAAVAGAMAARAAIS